MWNEALQLHAAGCLEQNYSVSLKPGRELRPQVVYIRRGDHPIGLAMSLREWTREITDPGDDVGSRLQCQLRDVGVALR